MKFAIPKPSTRPLKIYATDPTQGYEAALKISIAVEHENLTPGPVGDRLEVVDYDGHAKVYYDSVDLEDPAILTQGGLDPSEADPRFHQQMVYAVASRTLSNFDRALGRRLLLSRKKGPNRLRLFPHAFRGRNAFFDRNLHAILFGYFDADESNPGTNLPRQRIYTCLSHDIIAHEMTHAIVDRLRPFFLEPTNADTQAFHEGFSDIVALFQHFTFPNLLEREIQRNRGDLQTPTVLVELARQFGFAKGDGKSLRSALDSEAKLSDSVSEPHDRGAILVAAVFDGFFQTYRSRVDDLFRIATGGSGELPPGHLQPHLAHRIAAEAARTAQRHLDICIRAFDYLPPVDITFGDFLRALVTADFELNPDDEYGQRAALIEGFRKRRIYPEGVVSLAEESLRWPVAPDLPPMTDQLGSLLPQLLRMEADRFSQGSHDAVLRSRAESRLSSGAADAESFNIQGPLAVALEAYARQHREALHLRDDLPIQVKGFHAVFRTAANGRLLIELVAQLVQTDRTSQVDAMLGGLEVRGGTTIIVGVDGTVRYAIAKPLPGLPGALGAAGVERVERQKRFVSTLDRLNPRFPYMKRAEQIEVRMSIRALHSGH